MLEGQLKQLALAEGAVRVGIATRDAFRQAPPSADMRYLKPWANSVVSFAVSKGTDWIADYLGKKTRMVMRDNVYFVYHDIYRISKVIAHRLKKAGFKAHPVVPNGVYRPGYTFEKEVPDREIKPPVSLRYMAVGAGVGTFGWSGNLMVPGYWSNVYLGGVLTDAELRPDAPIEEELCDKCRICVRVCPVEYISQREETSVIIGGKRFTYNQKRGDLRCVIGCGGYTGLARSGKWSSWSTGRTVLPEDPEKLPEALVALRRDPANAAANQNLTFGEKGVLDRPLEKTKITCNNCATVCSGPLETRSKWMKLLFNSGMVELDKQGREVVVKVNDQGERIVTRPASS